MYRKGPAYALWCLFFVGLGGIHRIYVGKYGTGVLWLFTAGLFGVGQFVDLFRMGELVREANIREGHLPHPNFARRLAGGGGGTGLPAGGGEPSAPPAGPGAAASTDLDSDGAVMQRLLQEAEKRGGTLTVTQGVAATGLPFDRVEEVLREMVGSGYVDVDNAPDTGVVIYRFTELGGGLTPGGG